MDVSSLTFLYMRYPNLHRGLLLMDSLRHPRHWIARSRGPFFLGPLYHISTNFALCTLAMNGTEELCHYGIANYALARVRLR